MTQHIAVLRRSALEDSDCLFRFDKIHRQGIDDSGDYAFRGQAFALIKHLYINKLIAKGLPADAEEADAAFVEGVALHQTPNRIIGELRELWFRHAEYFTLDLDRYLTSEERQVGDGVSFAPDLVYAHPKELEVRDDKTYWTVLTEDEVRATYQARFYAWRAMKQWPNFPSYRITFVFVRFNKVASVVFTQAEIDQMEIEVRAQIARVREAEAREEWPAHAGPACRYCELRCPIADQQETLPVRIVGAEAAGMVGAWTLVAAKQLATVKKALKAYVTVNGPINVNGVVWANRPVVERKYPIGVVAEIVKDRNILGAFDDPNMTVSHSGLKKLFRQFPKLEEDLASVRQEKTVYRFGAKAAGDEDQGDEE